MLLLLLLPLFLLFPLHVVVSVAAEGADPAPIRAPLPAFPLKEPMAAPVAAPKTAPVPVRSPVVVPQPARAMMATASLERP